MKRAFIVLTLLLTAGCAVNRAETRPANGVTSNARPLVVAVEVLNTTGRTVDIYYGSQLLGVMSPSDRRTFALPHPSEGRSVYAAAQGEPYHMGVNLSLGKLTTRYILGTEEPIEK